jgi:BirA family transcriptional regulator, biotin operon repressor / biotin---[acetyl-CoA-carboxylase] ligase
VVFSALSAKMMGRLAQWNQGEHFATIRTDWLSRAAGLGDTISVRLAERELSGRFETIDDMGQLVLVEPEGTRYAIAVGDVVKLRWPGLGSGEG